MSDYVSRIQNHRIWELMTSLGPMIDRAEQLEEIDPTAVDALERVRAVLALSGKRLGASDPLTVLSGCLDSMAGYFESQKSEIDAYIKDRNPTHLTTANTLADSVLVSLSQIPGVANREEVIGLVKTVTSQRSALEQHDRISYIARQEATKEIQALNETLNALTTQTQSTVADLKLQLDTEKAKIVAQASDQQKQFVDAQQARGNTFSETLIKIQENLTKTISDQQGQFSSAQENRSREFAAAQTESQKRFGDLIADYTKRLADQDAEYTKQRDSFAATAQSELGALNKNFEQAATIVLEQVNNHRKDVEKLVGVIGNLGVTSGYQKAANSARNSMWFWNVLAVVAMVGLILFAYHAFLPTMQGDFKWGAFAGRVFLTITVGVLAAYSAAQADRFFHMEKYNRKLALELAAIDPFIAFLPKEEQDKFKLEIGRRSFAQEEVPPKDNKSPATTIDILASKEGQQVLQIALDALQRAVKGGPET
jgi:hypothetical protein